MFFLFSTASSVYHAFRTIQRARPAQLTRNKQVITRVERPLPYPHIGMESNANKTLTWAVPVAAADAMVSETPTASETSMTTFVGHYLVGEAAAADVEDGGRGGRRGGEGYTYIHALWRRAVHHCPASQRWPCRVGGEGCPALLRSMHACSSAGHEQRTMIVLRVQPRGTISAASLG